MDRSSRPSPSRRSRPKAPPPRNNNNNNNNNTSINIPNEVQIVASPVKKKDDPTTTRTTTTTTTSPKKRKKSSTAATTTAAVATAATQKVIIMPGDRLIGGGGRHAQSRPPPPPPPPNEAPPVVQQVVAFMLVGPPASGKTALVKSWVDRVAPSNTRKPKANLKTDTSTAAAAADKNKNHQEWTMDYFKKDLSFHSSSNKQLSVRVQLWDCYGTKDTTGALDDWKQVLNHQINTILLIVNARDYWDATSSSSSSSRSRSSKSVVSIQETIKEWKAWLDEQQQQQRQQYNSKDKKDDQQRHRHHHHDNLVPVELLLTQADQAFSSEEECMNVSSRSAMWKRFGAKMDRICRSCGIEAWHVTTASYDYHAAAGDDDDDDDFFSLREEILSVDELFCNLVETSLQRKRKQQSRAATIAVADQETPVALLGSPGKRKRVSPRSDASTIILHADAVVPLSPDAP